MGFGIGTSRQNLDSHVFVQCQRLTANALSLNHLSIVQLESSVFRREQPLFSSAVAFGAAFLCGALSIPKASRLYTPSDMSYLRTDTRWLLVCANRRPTGFKYLGLGCEYKIPRKNASKHQDYGMNDFEMASDVPLHASELTHSINHSRSRNVSSVCQIVFFCAFWIRSHLMTCHILRTECLQQAFEN